MKKKITVDIIIPFYEHLHSLKKLLKSINKLNLKNVDLKIFIIIDGSKINKKDLKTKTIHRLNFIQNKNNMGQTFSRNIGVKRSHGQFIWFIDADAEFIKKNTIQNAIKSLQKDIIGLSGTIEVINKKRTFLIPNVFLNGFALYKKIELKKNITTDIYDGTSLFVRRKTFLNIGYFDTKLKVYEEYEWSLRVAQEKRKFIFNPKCFVLHNNVKKKKEKFLLNYFDKSINTRAKILKKYQKNKFRLLFLYDLIIFPYIFFRLLVTKNIISTRFSYKTGRINIQSLYLISKKFFSSYFI